LFHCHTSNPVTYIITIPIAKPAIVNLFTETILLFLPLSLVGRNTHDPIEYTTWNIAPAPIDKNIMVATGEYKNPPIQAPAIVGAPAITPINTSLRNFNFLLLASGSTFG
jgi:hypothetical protein